MRYSYYQGVKEERSNKLVIAVASMALAIGLILSVIAQSVSAAVTTVHVYESTSTAENDPGWYFDRDPTTSTDYEFTTDEAGIGVGSLYVPAIGADPSDKFIAEHFVNTPLADVDSVSFDFLMGEDSDASDVRQFYMNVYANFGSSDDLKFYDCRYNVVATVGSTTSWSTVAFNPEQAYPVTTRTGASHTCPAVPAGMDSLDPGSNIRAYSLNVGDTSANDSGLSGYLDKVVVATTSNTVTYDFEPRTSPASKEACKNNGWENLVDKNGNRFKNQGLCVASVSSNENGKLNRQ